MGAAGGLGMAGITERPVRKGSSKSKGACSAAGGNMGTLWGQAGMGSRVAAPGHLASGHRLTFRGDANPVEVASQLLGDVGLPPGWQAHHHDHRGGVGQLRPTGCGGTDRGARDEDEAAYFLPLSWSSRTTPPGPPVTPRSSLLLPRDAPSPVDTGRTERRQSQSPARRSE